MMTSSLRTILHLCRSQVLMFVTIWRCNVIPIIARSLKAMGGLLRLYAIEAIFTWSYIIIPNVYTILITVLFFLLYIGSRTRKAGIAGSDFVRKLPMSLKQAGCFALLGDMAHVIEPSHLHTADTVFKTAFRVVVDLEIFLSATHVFGTLRQRVWIITRYFFFMTIVLNALLAIGPLFGPLEFPDVSLLVAAFSVIQGLQSFETAFTDRIAAWFHGQFLARFASLAVGIPLVPQMFSHAHYLRHYHADMKAHAVMVSALAIGWISTLMVVLIKWILQRLIPLLGAFVERCGSVMLVITALAFVSVRVPHRAAGVIIFMLAVWHIAEFVRSNVEQRCIYAITLIESLQT